MDFLCYSGLSFLCYLVIFSCFRSQTPTSCSTPSTRQSPDEGWAGPRTPRLTPHSPSVLAPQPPHLLPPFSNKVCSTHSLTHSHTPILHHKLVQKRVPAILQVRSRGSSRLAAAPTSPSLRTQSLVSGWVVSQGDTGTAIGSHGLQATRRPKGLDANPIWETAAGSPPPSFSL